MQSAQQCEASKKALKQLKAIIMIVIMMMMKLEGDCN